MSNINARVWKLLEEDLTIQKNLQHELINIRGLARYLIQKHQLQSSMDAVISAIRRFESDKEFKDNTQELKDIFSKTTVTTKNNMACLTIKETSFKTITLDFNEGKILRDNFRLIKSKELVKLFINQKDVDEKFALFNKKEVVHVEKDLAEIRIQIPMSGAVKKGLLARITHGIYLHDVNIYEILVAVPEILIYVKSNDLVKAHKAVLDLTLDDNAI